MSSPTAPLVLVSGASGLLGRAILREVAAAKTGQGHDEFRCLGTALSRSGPHLTRLDLTDVASASAFVLEKRPSFLVHAAAQRFPDKVAEDFEKAKALNVKATEALAKAVKDVGGKMIYISTDYVFDGKNPPYGPDSASNPLNTYGQLKLEGEQVTLATNPDNVILRIPVLYGPVEYLGESAVTTLLTTLLNKDKESVVSDYEIRRPSHVDDIAKVILGLIRHNAKTDVSGVYQWCGSEPMTKYAMVKAMSSAFGLSHAHVRGDADKPAGAGVSRPFDTTMDRGRLQEMGIEPHTDFAQGVKECLEKWVQEETK